MRKMGYAAEVEDVEKGICPFCKKAVNVDKDFRDDISRKEYKISGLCQSCQDDMFGRD